MDLSCGAKHSVNLFFSAWSAWLEWAECAVSCGGGIQSRSRTCINGSQGEEGCQGPDEELRVCNVDLCQTSAGIVIVYLLPTKTFFFNFHFCSVRCVFSIFIHFNVFPNEERMNSWNRTPSGMKTLPDQKTKHSRSYPVRKFIVGPIMFYLCDMIP